MVVGAAVVVGPSVVGVAVDVGASLVGAGCVVGSATVVTASVAAGVVAAGVVADGGTVPIDDGGADDSTVVVHAARPMSNHGAANLVKLKLRRRFMEPLDAENSARTATILVWSRG